MGAIEADADKVPRAIWELIVNQKPNIMAAKKRTTHRSSSGKKLYAVRDEKGRFVDIQIYKRAHGSDIKRKSKKEKK